MTAMKSLHSLRDRCSGSHRAAALVEYEPKKYKGWLGRRDTIHQRKIAFLDPKYEYNAIL